MRPGVLDTDVVSFLFKSDTRAQFYLQHLHDRQWVISFMTEAELEQWALLSNWHAKRIGWLRVFLARFVIVPSSRDLVLKWAEGMVADAPLLTHNAGDYLGVPRLRMITASR